MYKRQVYFRENSRMVRPDLNSTAEARVKGLVGLRECVQQLIDLQMDAATPDSAIQDKQAELNSLYDSFSAKYGLINDRANRLAYADDSSYYLLCALEVIDEDGKLERKADMFTKRTIKPHQAVEMCIRDRPKGGQNTMPTKAELYAQMADKVATQLTGSWQEWAGFLTTASRLYKYPFHEQLMIYAQRPDATACAEYDLWNEKMGQSVLEACPSVR